MEENDDPALRYKSPDDFNTVLSGRIGFKTSRAVFNINYSKMVGGERFLSPREWGRDPFYTFIPAVKEMKDSQRWMPLRYIISKH